MSIVTSSIFEADGRAIPFAEEGEGPVVVLLPGRGLGIASLGILSSVLAEDGFRAVRVGYRTRQTPDAITLHDLARDLVDVLEHLALSAVWIGGHGFGGAVARTVALDHPERVEGLVLLGVQGADTASDDAENALRTALGEPSETEALEAMRVLAGPSADATFAWSVFSRTRDTAVEPLQSSALAATPTEKWAPLAARIPVSIIQGSDDRLTPPANGEALRASAPERASIATIPGGGHLFVLTHAGEIGAEIEDYLGWD